MSVLPKTAKRLLTASCCRYCHRSHSGIDSSDPRRSIKSAGLRLTKKSKERRVPSSKIARVGNFGGLFVSIGVGAMTEAMKRSFGGNKIDKSVVMSHANAEKIVEVLCRMRGAALKLGQMLSLQDSRMLSPQLSDIFERVRHGADFMPRSQMSEVIAGELGSNWRDKFEYFDDNPFAAASIGQVHKGVLHDGREVAVKIQYPGVGDSIKSDIDNLSTLLKYTNLLPKGLYLENFMRVAETELQWEVDYLREASFAKRFREILINDPDLYVPLVIDDLTTRRILTSELIYGDSLENVKEEPQDVRNWIGSKMLNWCLQEMFTHRLMQTDPNWSNFLYSHTEQRLNLLDFGASREYSPNFVDDYLRLIKCASEADRDGVHKYSIKLQFLTGHETSVMADAHNNAIMILGEAFATQGPFNFGRQNTTDRIHNLIPIMVEHRLTPPPDESYSLHRKMSGVFLLCSRLNASIHCKEMFDRIWKDYKFLT